MLRLTVVLLLISFLTSQSALVEDNLYAKKETFQNQSIDYEYKELDQRATILKAYLEKHNSPLQNHTQDFIDAADTYELDWKLVPAIAGVESTFGKHIPGGYNGWGWGVYGTQAIYFKSWREGIFTVSYGLKKNYIDKGLTDPYKMNKIYATSPKWGSKVSFFVKDIESFAKLKALDKTDKEAPDYLGAKIAEDSGKLVFKI